MHRITPRLTRLLASAAVVPAVLVTGCSAGPDSGAKGSSADGASSAEGSATPTMAAARYGELPPPCSTLGKKTTARLVPKAKNPAGTTGKSADTSARGTCSWNGLDGFQYRWLDVSLQLFDSDPTLGSGDSRAKEYFSKQVAAASSPSGVKNLRTGAAAGLGDQASTVSYIMKKNSDEYRNHTVVARTANIVITLNYNGAGFEDTKAPNSDTMLKDARSAVGEVVAALAGSGA